MKTPYSYWAEVNRELGRPLTDDELNLFQDEGYISDPNRADDMDYGPEEFAEKVKRFRKAFGPSEHTREIRPRTSSSPVKVSGLREQTLATLQAEEAGRNEAVQAFRHEVLGDRLLAWDTVETWLNTQHDQEPRRDWLTNGWIPLRQVEGRIDAAIDGDVETASAGLYRLLEQDEVLPPTLTAADAVPMPVQVLIDAKRVFEHLDIRALHCYVPVPNSDDERVWRAVTGAGVLERLRLVGEELALEYGWYEADAVCFILTGRPPYITTISEVVHVDKRVPTRSHITLRVDPTVLPSQVANYYRHVRKEVLRGQHYRKLSDKHLELARFAALRSQGEPSAQRMRAWNAYIAKKHPDWRKYNHVSNFTRDCAQARRRLLHPNRDRSSTSQ